MLERLRGVLAVGAVLGVPFLLRPREDLLDPHAETVVVVTPNNEATRYEFSRGFMEHERAAHGRSVRIDWRTPGGTTEIARFLSSEYAASFETYWKTHLHKAWTARIAAAYANPAIAVRDAGADPDDEKLARRTFLASDVTSGIDLSFGGGSFEFAGHAAAGRLVDSGIVRAHPELFNDEVIPASLGGEPYWDRDGRWVGTCLSGFGICFNRDSLAELGLPVPSGYIDLTDPKFRGRIALADPSKSGSAAKTFEMIVQQEMGKRLVALGSAPDRDVRAPREGWDAAMRLIRRIGANARYFTDSAAKIPIDVASGDAAAGTCIDFYGRFQSEAASKTGHSRLGFVMPPGSTSIGVDPIGLLRGAPHRELASELMEYLLSLDGQKLWDFKVGTPGGPTRYALRRLPILPSLYRPEYAPFLSDPDEKPYEQARSFDYRPAWTGPLFRALTFIVRAMCVDTEVELQDAYRTLVERHFPPGATALFDDVEAVDYARAAGPVRAALGSPDPRAEATLTNELVSRLRQQYLQVAAMAREGR